MASPKSRPLTRIAILGSSGHGKTALVASLAKTACRLSNVKPRAEAFSAAPEVRSAAHLHAKAAIMRFSTLNRNYDVIDFATHTDAVKGLIAGTDVDGVVLAVSAAKGIEGVDDRGMKEVELARRIGVRHVVVVLVSMRDQETDQELPEPRLQQLEKDVHAMLAGFGFGRARTAVARVAVRPAEPGGHAVGVRELLGTLDRTMPATPASSQKPFLMIVQDMLSSGSGGGLMVFGTLVRGHCPAGGTAVEAFGRTSSSRVVCEEVDMTLSAVHGGTEVMHQGLLLGPSSSSSSFLQETPYLLAAPGTVSLYRKFIAQVHVLCAHERSMGMGWSGDVHVLGAQSHGVVIKLPTGVGGVPPGAEAKVMVQMKKEVAMEVGTRVTFCEGEDVIAVAVVCTILG